MAPRPVLINGALENLTNFAIPRAWYRRMICMFLRMAKMCPI